VTEGKQRTKGKEQKGQVLKLKCKSFAEEIK